MDEGPLASRFRRRLVMVMLAVYTAFVLFITLSPRLPGDGFLQRNVNRVLRFLHERGHFMWLDYMGVEFIANILMFVPLGVFVALLISRNWWWTLLFMGTIFSMMIELTQFLFLTERYPDPRDLLSNTLGFLLGAISAILIRLLVAHRDKLVERDRRTAAMRAGRPL